jgi:acyl-CoA dehydrogenase
MSEFTAELVSVTSAVVDRIGVELSTPARGVDTSVWREILDGGFATVGIPEELGGGGASIADSLAVVTTAAEKGALTPIVEHGILAAWLAADAGFDLASSTATVAIDGSECAVRLSGNEIFLDGTVTDVAYAADVDTVLVTLPSTPDSPGVTLAAVSMTAPGVTMSSDTDLVGVSLAEITFDGAAVLFHGELTITVDDVMARGALAYAAASAAVAGEIEARTVRYASERTQFGRPLAKFQAIQQRLAGLAAVTTLMRTASHEAVSSYEGDDPRTALAALAAAKVVTSRSAHAVAASGHQIHGAIGFTSEHPLGRYTTSLWSWRDRYGSEQYWADVLAGLVLDEGADVWDLVTGTSYRTDSTTGS